MKKNRVCFFVLVLLFVGIFFLSVDISRACVIGTDGYWGVSYSSYAPAICAEGESPDTGCCPADSPVIGCPGEGSMCDTTTPDFSCGMCGSASAHCSPAQFQCVLTDDPWGQFGQNDFLYSCDRPLGKYGSAPYVFSESDTSALCEFNCNKGFAYSWIGCVSEHSNSIIYNPGSGNTNSGNTNSGNTNSGNTNSGNTNSGNTNSGNTNSGNTNSGNTNSGNTGSSGSCSGSYVTTGSEAQVKSGAFGIIGLFKAFGGISVNSKRMFNVGMPIAGTDVATKEYIEQAIAKAKSCTCP